MGARRLAMAPRVEAHACQDERATQEHDGDEVRIMNFVSRRH